MALGFLFAAKSTVTAEKATVLPSGEICGSPTRITDRSAFASNGSDAGGCCPNIKPDIHIAAATSLRINSDCIAC